MANYQMRHKPNPVRSTKAVLKRAVVSRPTAKSGRAPQRGETRPVRRVVRTHVTKEDVVAKKRHVENRAAAPIKTSPPAPVKPPSAPVVLKQPKNRRPVVGANGMKPGRATRDQKLSRVGRADLRHTVRSAQHQRILREHVNKIREMKDAGSGKILVMIACGPSVNEVDFTPLLNHPHIDIMCINKPLKQVWPSTFWSFCDLSQYQRNKDTWATYNGIIWNSQSVRVPHQRQIMVRNRSGQGFSRNLTDGYFISRTTTYASMQVAYWMGYQKVYIFGCDMGLVNGKLHHYGKNPDVDDSNRLKRFAKESEAYNYAATVLTKPERDRFYFCSAYNKYAFTHKFNYMDHLTAVQAILAHANSLVKK